MKKNFFQSNATHKKNVFLLSKKKSDFTENQKISCGENVKIYDSVIQGCNRFSDNTLIYKSIIGYGSYLGENCYINRAKIGKYCSFGSEIRIISGHHPINECISTHPSFYSATRGSSFSYVKGEHYSPYRYAGSKMYVVIGNDVWIGDRVSIMEGVKIGDGAIVGAGAMVVCDIPSYSVYAGVPARMIRKRFTEEESALLREFKWWNKSEKWINSNADLFMNPELFFIKIREEMGKRDKK